MATKLDADKGWMLDDDMPFGDDVYREMLRRCYPNYCKAFSECKPDDNGKYIPSDMGKLRKALENDEAQAAVRIERTPQMPDEFNLNPDSFPGQNN